MLPRRRGPADDGLVRLHPLAVPDGGPDVPVLELGVAVAGDDGDRLRPERLESHDAVERRVDGCAVGARDVDPEVEAAAHPLRRHPDARVAEEPANGVLRVERLHRPAVGRLRGGSRRRYPVRRTGREAWRQRRCRPRSRARRDPGNCERGSHAATLGATPNRPTTAVSRSANGVRSETELPPEVLDQLPSRRAGRRLRRA